MAPEKKLKEAVHLSLVPGRAVDALELAVLAAEASKGDESGELQRDAILLQAECELMMWSSSADASAPASDDDDSPSSGWRARVTSYLDTVLSLMPNGVAEIPDCQEMAKLRAMRARLLAATSTSMSANDLNAARGWLEPYGEAPKPMSKLTGDDFFSLGRAWAALGLVERAKPMLKAGWARGCGKSAAFELATVEERAYCALASTSRDWGVGGGGGSDSGNANVTVSGGVTIAPVADDEDNKDNDGDGDGSAEASASSHRTAALEMYTTAAKEQRKDARARYRRGLLLEDAYLQRVYFGGERAGRGGGDGDGKKMRDAHGQSLTMSASAMEDEIIAIARLHGVVSSAPTMTELLQSLITQHRSEVDCGATEAADFVMMLYHFKARQLVAQGVRVENKVNRPDPALTEAVKAYREAVEVEPECGPSVYCHLSRALRFLGQHDAAADVITKCRERYKTNPCVMLFYCLAKAAATEVFGALRQGGGGGWKCPSVLWQLRFAVLEALRIALARGPGFGPRAPLSEDLLHLHDPEVVKVGMVLAAGYARESDPETAAELLTGLVAQLPVHAAALSASAIARAELHELLSQARELLMPVLLELNRVEEAAAVGEALYTTAMSGGGINMDVDAVDSLVALCRALVRASVEKPARKQVSVRARLGAALFLRVDRDISLDKAIKMEEKTERLAEAEAALRDALALEPEGEVTPPREVRRVIAVDAGGAAVGANANASAVPPTNGGGMKSAAAANSSASVSASSTSTRKGGAAVAATVAKTKAVGAMLKSGASSNARGKPVTSAKVAPHRPGGGGPKIIPKPPPSALKKAATKAATAAAVSKAVAPTKAKFSAASASKTKPLGNATVNPKAPSAAKGKPDDVSEKSTQEEKAAAVTTTEKSSNAAEVNRDDDEPGMCNGRSITARIELAKVLRERLGFGSDGVFVAPPLKGDTANNHEGRKAVEEICQLYREVIIMDPRNVDAVTGLALMLEKAIESSSSSSAETALAVLSAFPDPVANDEAGDFDDSYVHVEIIRLIMRAADAEAKGGDKKSADAWLGREQLEKSMVIAGKVMGMQGIEKWVEVLDSKGKWDMLMRVYAAVNRHLEPNMLQAHFKIKGWSMHQ